MLSATEILSKRVFGGSGRRCAVAGCGQWATQAHHVTYTPEVTEPLCERHHDEITAINSHQARKQGPLSEKQRWAIWYKFCRGELKRPRFSHLDREWFEGRRRGRKPPREGQQR
jgi:hypothetical protein